MLRIRGRRTEERRSPAAASTADLAPVFTIIRFQSRSWFSPGFLRSAIKHLQSRSTSEFAGEVRFPLKGLVTYFRQSSRACRIGQRRHRPCRLTIRVASARSIPTRSAGFAAVPLGPAHPRSRRACPWGRVAHASPGVVVLEGQQLGRDWSFRERRLPGLEEGDEVGLAEGDLTCPLAPCPRR